MVFMVKKTTLILPEYNGNDSNSNEYINDYNYQDDDDIIDMSSSTSRFTQS